MVSLKNLCLNFSQNSQKKIFNGVLFEADKVPSTQLFSYEFCETFHYGCSKE